MNDDEIRARVREQFAAGSLPRRIVLAGTVSIGGAFGDRCAVCGVGTTQLRYHTVSKAWAFHQRCHAIWKEEADRPSAR